MARKVKEVEEVETELEEKEVSVDTDFNLETDYKETPILYTGEYTGAITDEKMAKGLIQFELTVGDNQENEVCTDGQTQSAGCKAYYKIWLPVAGDREKLVKSGKQTKFQWKINNMAEAFKALEFPQRSFAEISEAVNNKDHVGVDVKFGISHQEYKGKIQENVDWIKRA